MKTLFEFLASAVGPLAIRVLLAVGISTVTFTGVTDTLDLLIREAQQNWSSVPAAMIQLASLSGFPEAIGLVFGAMSTRVAAWVSLSATKWVMNK
jgi:hypothetical protein